MKCLILLLIGIFEECINVLYYKAGQKNYKYLLSILTIFRGLMWYYVLRIIFIDSVDSFKYFIFYVIGNVIGDWVSLSLEPYIDKFVIHIRRVGRKKKRWFLKRKAQRKR